MGVDFSKLKQTNSLIHMKSKFFATFFTTLITAAINISRDSKGLLYILFRQIYISIPSLNANSSLLLTSLKNIVSTFTRCVDVALNVIIIFFVIYAAINITQRKIYSKRFKKRRQFLKAILWETIIPNLLEVNKLEVEFVSNINGLENTKKSHWCMVLSTLLEMHREVLSMLEREGVFEFVSDGKRVTKTYTKYLNEINFPAVYILFVEEERTLSLVCEKIKNEALYETVYNQYTLILKKHHDTIKRMKTNKILINL